MKLITKLFLLVAVVFGLTLSACGSKEVSEEDAEQAVIDQSADLEIEGDLQDATSDEATFSDEDTFGEDAFAEPSEVADTSMDDTSYSEPAAPAEPTYSEATSQVYQDDSNLGASSSGLGH